MKDGQFPQDDMISPDDILRDEVGSRSSRGEESAHHLPKDLYKLVLVIGVIAGIIHYVITHDSWLLLTFLSIMFGGLLNKHIHAGRNQ